MEVRALETRALASAIVGELLADHQRSNLFQRAGVGYGAIASILVDERGIEPENRQRIREAVVRQLRRSRLLEPAPEQIPTLVPGSPEWLQTITASKVAVILGLSPFDSPRSLWDLMTGRRPRGEVNAAMGAGTDLEAGILDNYFRRHPELRRVGREVTIGRDGLPWAAANPDDIATRPDGIRFPVQAKYAAGDGDSWGQAGTDEVPPYYYVQSLWEQHLGGYPFGVLTVLLPFRGPTDFVVEYDAELAADIEAECLEFYESVQAGTEPPELDDSVATFESLRSQHPEIERGTSVDVGTELGRAFLIAKHHADRYEARRRLAFSRMYEAMGTAQYAVVDGVKVARRQPSAGGKVALYRQGKITADQVPNNTIREDEIV